MPFIFSERLPVPTLKSYVCISLLIFTASAVYWKRGFSGQETTTQIKTTGSSLNLESKKEYSDHNDDHGDALDMIISEPCLLWPLVNMAFCCLFLGGKFIQTILLGNLRLVEEQHLQERFWNFVFYKVIFIFGVISAQSLHEVLCWATWFSLLGFLNIFLQICEDRYDHVTSNPTMTQSNHVKLLVLIFGIFMSSLILGTLSISYHGYFGFNEFVFMLTECVLFGMKSLNLFLRYIFQLKNLQQTGLWDAKNKMVYYTNLILKFVILSIDLGFHFHMILWSNVFISMASLVLYWNIRSIFSTIKKLLKKHRLYKKILKSVNARLPMASKEELEQIEDHCAICWEGLRSARKLPCGHFFHHACLCSWLEQDFSCPTCRRPLSGDIGIPQGAQAQQADQNEGNENDFEELAAENLNQNGGGGGGLRNYFFYLDGQQIANWFPSFSIEVFHGRMEEQNEEELNEMAQQLFTMFPQTSQEEILQDLNRTHSVEATADNILEGLLSTVPEETPPIIDQVSTTTTTTDERPQINQNVAMSSVLESATTGSDNESLIEDSSGAEENVQQIRQHAGVESNFEVGGAALRRTHVTSRDVLRRRQLKRTNRSSSTEQSSEGSNNITSNNIISNNITSNNITSNNITSNNATEERTSDREVGNRRNILLEAIGRRNNPSTT